MSSTSPKVQYADAVRRLAEANARRAAKGQAPLTMNRSGDIALSNGALAAYVVDSKTGKPRFQIYQGASKSYLQAIQGQRNLGPADAEGHRHRQYAPLSAAQADNAWRRGFAKKSYKSEATRKRAMSRNKCSPCKPQKTVNDSRFLSNPTKLCYTGLNDGTAPECADRVAKYANPSPKSIAGRAVSARKLAAWRQAHTVVGSDGKRHLAPGSRKADNTTNHVSKPYKARSKRAQAGGSRHQEEEEEQQGGRAVSLKTAVRLLRQYYNSKYN